MSCGLYGRTLLIANLADGQTIRFDLRVSNEFLEWEKFVASSNGNITALSILSKNRLYAFPKPNLVRDFGAELVKKSNGDIVAERIWCHCGEVRIVLTVFDGKSGSVSRIDVRQLGAIRFKPRRRQ